MRANLYLLSLPLLAVSLSAGADIYRCTGASGEPSFSHRPCAAGSAVVPIDKPAPARSAGGLRPGEKSWLQAREREKRRLNRRRTSSRAAASTRTGAGDRRAHQCLRKRRALDAVKADLRRGYRPAQGEKLRRRRRSYQDYLDAFCS